jgi:predicted nucleic acid-binding protein
MIRPVFLPGIFLSPVFILDAGVTVVWELTRRANKYSDEVQWRLRTDSVLVPTIWTLDLTDRLLAAERIGETDQRRVDLFLSRLSSFQIFIEDEAPFRYLDILNRARRHSVTVSEAAYLELAIRFNLPLATIDPSLTRAAAAAGVSLFVP